jgi:hypothetical protein
VTVRVYVPTGLDALAQYVEQGGLGPSPLHAHAVTRWLRESWPEAEQDEWEYAVLMAAADDSAREFVGPARPRRVVVVAEVESVTEDPESTAVVVDAAISMRLVRAVHADTDDIDPAAPENLEDLAWFGVQEIPDLLH